MAATAFKYPTIFAISLPYHTAYFERKQIIEAPRRLVGGRIGFRQVFDIIPGARWSVLEFIKKYTNKQHGEIKCKKIEQPVI